MKKSMVLESLARMRAFARNNRFLVRTLAAMVLVCSILLSALSGILYASYSRIGREDVYSVSKVILDQAYRSADRQLTAIHGYFSSLYRKDPHVFEAMYAKDFDPVTMFEIGRKIRTWVELNPLVSSIYIYNRDAGWVFSSQTSARHFSDFFDQDMSSRLDDPSIARYPIFIPRTPHYQVYQNQEEPRLVSLVFAESEGTSSIDSALVVNIDLDKVLDILSMSTSSRSGLMMVLDRTGRVVIHPERSTVGFDLSGESYYERIRNAERDDGWFIARVGGKQHYVAYFRSSPVLGWYFVSLIESDKLLEGISRLRTRMFLWTGFAILSAGIVSLLLSRTIFKPFNEFLQRVREMTGSGPDKEGSGELDYLSRVFDGLSSDISELMDRLEATESIRKKEAFQKLLLGDDPAGLDPVSKEFVSADGSGLVCILRIDGFQDLTERCTPRELAMIRAAIADMSKDLLSGFCKVEAFETSEDSLCLMLGHPAGIDRMTIQSWLERLRDSIRTLMNLSVSIGIGQPLHVPSDIPASWRAAQDAVDMRFVRGIGLVHLTGQEPRDEDGQYPTALESLIVDALKLDNPDAYTESLDRFLEAIRNHPNDRIKLFIAQLAMALRRTLTDGFRIRDEVLGLSWRDIGSRLAACDSMEQARQWLLEVGRYAISTLSRKKDGKREQLVDRVRALVEENHADPNLSVDQLAAQVGLSVNHLRLVFRESTGESVSDLVARVRFDHAKTLLRTTVLPAKRIAVMVGFPNHNYFYVNFKKVTGYSPETYRKRPPEA